MGIYISSLSDVYDLIQDTGSKGALISEVELEAVAWLEDCD